MHITIGVGEAKEYVDENLAGKSESFVFYEEGTKTSPLKSQRRSGTLSQIGLTNCYSVHFNQYWAFSSKKVFFGKKCKGYRLTVLAEKNSYFKYLQFQMAFSDYYGINKLLFSAFQPILSIFEKKSVFRKKMQRL